MKKFLSKVFPVKRQEQLVGFLAASGNLLFWVVPVTIDLYRGAEEAEIAIAQSKFLLFGLLSLFLAILCISSFNLSWWYVFAGLGGYVLSGILLQLKMRRYSKKPFCGL